MRVGVIQDDQQLAFLDGVAFLDKNVPYSRRERSVSLKVVDRFNFSVGGNQAADRASFNDGRSHRGPVIATGDEGSQHNHCRQDRKRRHQPPPRLASRTVSIQWHVEKSASFNVYHPRAAGSREMHYGLGCLDASWVLFASTNTRRVKRGGASPRGQPRAAVPT